MCIRRRAINTLLLLLCLVLPAQGGELKNQVRWEGRVELKESLIIPVDGELVIAAGTEVVVPKADIKLLVHGRLQIDGTSEEPVLFTTPEGWQGIDFMETRQENRIAQARFSAAEVVISSYGASFSVIDSIFKECRFSIKLLRESDPEISGNRFSGGEIAIDNEMRSAPQIRGNHFSGLSKTAILASHNSKGPIIGNQFVGNQQGVGLLQPYPDEVRGNRFVDNQVGLYCNQTKNTPRVIGNHFEGNQRALISYAFAYPLVRDNRFIGNQTALLNDQFGSPQVEHNLFADNKEAIHNNRKSNPKVQRNILRGNGLVMFCDYSSYPLFEQNNLQANRQAVKLGIYQSADWEKRSGSKRLVMQRAKARQSKNSMLAQAPTEFTDRVEVANNWWGEQTGLLRQAEEDANLELFWDRHDQPKVVYEGFGPDEYALDLVVFQPLLDGPVVEAGPREQK